jgi:hypothetical protein
MRSKGGDQFIERAGGVSDGVENSQQVLDAENLGGDSIEHRRDERILICKHRT